MAGTWTPMIIKLVYGNPGRLLPLLTSLILPFHSLRPRSPHERASLSLLLPHFPTDASLPANMRLYRLGIRGLGPGSSKGGTPAEPPRNGEGSSGAQHRVGEDRKAWTSETGMREMEWRIQHVVVQLFNTLSHCMGG